MLRTTSITVAAASDISRCSLLTNRWNTTQATSDQARRLCSQALFKRISIDENQTISAETQAPFDTIIEAAEHQQSSPNPGFPEMPEVGTCKIWYTSLDETQNSYQQQQKVFELLKQAPISDTPSRDSLQIVDRRGTVVTTDWTTPTTYTPKLVEKLGREYQDGLSSTRLAKKYSLNAGTIRKHLRRAGIEICKGLTREESKRAMRLRDSGMTYAAIGKRLGYSISTIQRCVNRSQPHL